MYQKLLYSVMLAVFALVAVPSTAHAQVQNLVLNPSFETDEVILNDPAWEQWCTWGYETGLNSTVEISETEFADGAKSLRIIPKGDTNWYFILLHLPIYVDVNKNYTVSFWAKAEKPRPLTVQLKATDNSINAWGATDFALTTEWAEYHYASDVKINNVKLEILCSGSEVPFWLDFVFMYEGDYIAGIAPSGAGGPGKAARPEPADGAVIEQTWATLSWKPSALAASHNVYVGDNSDDVDKGTADTFRGNQPSAYFTVGFPGFPYPDGLVPGTTYYWRIDEVNEADPNSPWKGDLWSFSVAPRTAYGPDPADGAEFVGPANVTLKWKPGLGAKLHTVYFGDNFDTVSNAAGGLPQAAPTFSAGSLKPEKVYYWRVDEFDGASTYKGNVWAFTTPGAAGSPKPVNGAAGMQMVSKLSWTPATTAVSHDLYFGTDKEAVKNATAASPEYKGSKAKGSESYDPGKLAWYTPYYWRVDAVYATGTVKGLVWSFTTADFLLVDDFESYNDLDPPDPASNRIFDKWIDGFATPTTNGALVGNDLPPYADQATVHGGAQSMPYRYDNANKTSEATLTLVYPRDWTEEGVAKLSLWFRGASANAAERMCVTLNGGTPVYHSDAKAAQAAGWTEWVIDLQAFQGVTLTNVNTISIGFGTKGSPAAGGTGKVYFDDIRLRR